MVDVSFKRVDSVIGPSGVEWTGDARLAVRGPGNMAGVDRRRCSANEVDVCPGVVYSSTELLLWLFVASGIKIWAHKRLYYLRTVESITVKIG